MDIFEDAIRKLYEETNERIKYLDGALREKYHGRPVDEIREPARTALAQVAMTLSDEELTAYCHAISASQAFEVRHS
ncbi:MAG: hypothetical protein JWN95_3437 [Frankiales bacterium]|nr:hypothetical protein [Frankiales bacterium]